MPEPSRRPLMRTHARSSPIDDGAREEGVVVSHVLAPYFLRPAGEPEAIELPSYFKVLQERLDFVLCLGLSTDDLSSYLLLLACSIRKNTSIVVDLTPIVKSLLRCTLVDRLISTVALHYHHSHQIKAPMPTWLIVKATPQPRDGAKKLAAAAYSPLLLSPSVWQKA
uniref:Uncharacterized protein n=1 Tax=Oryza barthii TaxID=65489 RepID=A0A0D3GGC0_9ORYZ